MNLLTTLCSRRTWFGSHDIARGNPLVQSANPGCYSVTRIQYVPDVTSAGYYPADLKFNCISPSSAIAEKAWKYKSTADLSNMLFILLLH